MKPPAIAITTSDPFLTAGEAATLTFTLSEPVTDFVAADVTVSGGALSNFTGSGTSYSATFTPAANSTVNGVVSVASGKFTDAAGNANTDGAEADNTVRMTVDTQLPTIAVSASDLSLTAGEAATLTFTLSEPATDFLTADVTVSGGTLSNFTGSGTSYSATFTPAANSTADGVVSVASGKFTDAAGNANVDGAEADNTVRMTVDTQLPTIAVSASDRSLRAGEAATLTFTVSEPITDFVAADVTVSGGTLSNFTGSGTSYSATFTPTANSTANGVVSVASGKFTDAAGNANADGTEANNTVTMAVDTTVPTIALTASDTLLTVGEKAALTFTLSEATTNFAASDVTVSGGALSNFTGSGTSYSATFTPTANSTADGVINVASGKFTDAAGNANVDGAEADNTVTMAVDTTVPTVASFTPADAATGVAIDSNIVVTFSEAIQRGTGNIGLKTAAGATVATYNAAISPNLTLAGDTLIIDPSAGLAYSTRYRVEFAAGTIKDLAGNNYAGTTSYDFTTAARVNSPPSGALTITGTPTQGEILSVDTSGLADADGLGTFRYQWLKGGAAISGATSRTFQLRQSEVDSQISVRVNYTDGGGTVESLTSPATSLITNTDDEATGTLSLTGTVAEGGRLIASLNNVVDADGATTTAWQWQLSSDGTSGWVDLGGATAATYSIAADQSQVGKYLRVVATTTDALGGTTTFIGNASAKIANVNDAPTLAQPLADQAATEDAPFAYTVPVATFNDADGDALSFAAALANGNPLPDWLTFDTASRKLSGTPDSAAVGTLSVLISAADAAGATAFDNFNLNIMASVKEYVGTTNNDTLTGTVGDGTFTGLAGDDTLNGGAGSDTAIYSGAAKDYLVFLDKAGKYIVNDLNAADGDDGRDTLTEVEFLQFTTGKVPVADALTKLTIIDDDPYYWNSKIGLPNGEIVSAAEAQLFRTYFGTMQRLPDDGGFNWWLGEIEAGRHDLRSMAAGFIWSDEFHGYVNVPPNRPNDIHPITNDVFLTHMYKGVFGRDPDGEGYNWWLNELNSGHRTQTDVLVDMTQSNEYVEITLLGVVDYLY